MADSTRRTPPTLPLLMVLFTLTRLVIDTNFRMVYPYLSTFQEGLGVSLTSLSLLLTVRAMTGFIGPFFAPLADWRGRRISMLLGVGGFTAGALLIYLWPGYLTFFAGSILMATSGLIYVPAMQAYLSDRMPFERRGRIIGITELSWSLSFFIGVPLIGWLLVKSGTWSAPFAFFAILGTLFFILIFRTVSPDGVHHAQARAQSNGFNLRDTLRSPGLLLGLGMSFMMCAANESVNIVFGLWLEDSFQMQLAALGGASLVIGLAELGGGGLSAWIVDRLGKQLAVGIGLLLNCLAAAVLLLLGRTPTGALVGLFVFYLTFEFALVSTIPLMSEAVPGLRATAIAATMSVFGIGRAFSSALGPFLYTTWGFSMNIAAALILNLAAILLLSRLRIVPRATEAAVIS